VPRLREARWLAERGAHAAVDVSDGLAADLAHLATASGVRVVLELDRVPVAPGVDPASAAASGEEYELALAVPESLAAPATLAAFAEAHGVPLTVVGRVATGAPGLETVLRGARVAPPGGHDHFSR
jgi:thiamine-monophosphate kinase